MKRLLSRLSMSSFALVLLCCIHATATIEHACAQGGDAAAATVARPAEGDALAAYLAARAWLDGDSLPAEGSAAAKVRLANTTGVCVLLRLDGRLVGSGDAGVAPAAADGDERDLLLRKAVGRAVAKALADETIAAVRRSVGDTVTARLALEVELAGPMRPLIGRTVAEAAQRVNAGDEGIALLRAEQCFRAYPSRLLAVDIAARPDRTITALLVDAGLPVKELNQFGPTDRVSFGRFDTIRLRADRPGDAPAVVTRCGRLIETFELTRGRTQALAAQLASRLASQVVPRDPSDPAKGVALLGTLNPTADTYSPPFAPTRDAALAALALSLAGRSTALPEPTRAFALERAHALVRSLAELPTDAPKAVDGAPRPAERDPSVDCLLTLAARTHPDAGVRARLAARTAELALTPQKDPTLAALIAAAQLTADPALGAARAAECTREILAAQQGSRARLIDAALPLALIATDPAADNATKSALAELFEEFSRLARTLQIRRAAPEFAHLPADLEGGLMLPGSTTGVPDTQCLPLAAALARLEPALPEAGRPDRLASRQAFVRFLAQHVAADPWAGGFRNPGALRGLVRGALSGDDCPPGPTSAGLMLALFASESAVGIAAPSDGTRP